jgi:hypothetical protein
MLALAVGVPLVARRLNGHHETELMLWGPTVILGLRCAVTMAHSTQQRLNAPRIVAAFGARLAARAITKTYATFWYQGTSERELRAVGVSTKLPAHLRALVAEGEAATKSPYRAGQIGALIVQSAESSTTFVIFEADRFHVVDGVPVGCAPTVATLLADASSRRTFTYEKMRRLRVEAPRWIRGEDPQGVAISVRISAADVPRVEAFLLQVGQRVAVDASGAAAATIPRVMGLLGAVAGVAISLPATLLGLVVLIRPEPATLGALAGASLGAGVSSLSGESAWLGGAVAVISVIAASRVRPLREALAASGRATPARWWLFVPLVLAGLYFCLANLPTTSSSVGLRTHFTLRDNPWGAVVLMATAGALAASERRVARLAAIVPGALGVVALLVGSPHIGGRFPGSPFAERLASIPINGLETAPLHEVEVEDGAMLRLSPDAELFSTTRTRGGRDPKIVVGNFAGKQRSIDANEIVFLGGRRALAVKYEDRSELRAITFDDALAESVEWRIEVAAPLRSVAVRRDTGQWSAVARTEDGDRLYGGRVGASDVEMRILTNADGRHATFDWQPVGDGGALAVAAEYGHDGMRVPLFFFRPGVGFQQSVLAWTPNAGVATLVRPELRTTCRAPLQMSAPATCSVHDTHSDSLFGLDLTSGAVTPIGRLDHESGEYDLLRFLDADERSLVFGLDRRIVIVDLKGRHAAQIAMSSEERWGASAALADRHIAVSTPGRARYVVRLYARP